MNFVILTFQDADNVVAEQLRECGTCYSMKGNKLRNLNFIEVPAEEDEEADWEVRFIMQLSDFMSGEREYEFLQFGYLIALCEDLDLDFNVDIESELDDDVMKRYNFVTE